MNFIARQFRRKKVSPQPSLPKKSVIYLTLAFGGEPNCLPTGCPNEAEQSPYILTATNGVPNSQCEGPTTPNGMPSPCRVKLVLSLNYNHAEQFPYILTLQGSFLTS